MFLFTLRLLGKISHLKQIERCDKQYDSFIMLKVSMQIEKNPYIKL